MKVFANGYGFVKFAPKEKKSHAGIPQLKGRIKLPKGVTAVGGGRWIDWNYWYALSEVHVTLDDLSNKGLKRMLKKAGAVLK